MNKTIIQKDKAPSSCIFCEKLERGEYLLKNESAFAIYDAFPVTTGHILVLPIRHVGDCFDLFEKERQCIYEIVGMSRARLMEQDAAITGFNIGVNCGADAGQTIFHCHVHLIPRRKGDAPDPRGGVRGVIPGKMHY
ncbi:HIT family protein [Candidatus Sumerlaeota bacterium]|nr:HIT family protein [Candidatus Sumerlaeota bacterium]